MKIKLTAGVFLLSIFFANGCAAESCDGLKESHFDIMPEGISFRVVTLEDKYWGSFDLHAVDHSIGYYDNSYVKFRVDISSLEFVRFQSGKLYLKDSRSKAVRCISRLEEKNWADIKGFVKDWPEASRFEG